VTLEAVLGLAIFVGTYALIATERIHKAVAALAGGVLMILLGIVSQEQAFEEIDFNVIFLLAGMMILAAIIRTTGVFGWLAIRAARLAGGEPYRILVVLSVITAVASAFLDNVTTVVLVGPITLFLAARLGMNPFPFLVSEILASNIGGSATLIGDPPNLLIGSAAGLDFTDFLLVMTPLAILLLAVYLVAARWLFRGMLDADPDLRSSFLDLDERSMITRPTLLRQSLAVMGLTLLGFLAHGALHLEPATIALAGAAALMLIARVNPDEILREVEWPTLFFFIGLFMLVAGVIEIGLIDAVAAGIEELTGGALAATSLLVLWVSAVLSALIDNIPYTATMIPVVAQLSEGQPNDAIWWALAIGADLGGNATLIGASANVILAGMSEREGHPITFSQYLRFGVPVTLGTMVIATVYLWIRFLV
jgi:Na+/H+ antiporter NhaD/arsenite permease-like protein